MIFKILALGALAVAATASPAPSAWSWNELVGAENLFHPEIDSIQTKSLESAVLVSELTELLSQPKVLAAVYRTYMTQYEKEASRMVHSEPQTNFKRALIEIAEHNLGAKLGQYKWFEGVNQFTDMSDAEYKKYLTYYISFADYYQNSSIPQSEGISKDSLPTQEDSVDWVAKGMVTTVRNQKSCGSCYAFSSIGQLESCALILGYSNKDELDLSEQQVVDCTNTTEFKNKGCSGGSIQATNRYLKGGVATEADYAYQVKQGPCQDIASAPPKVVSVYPTVRTEDDLHLYVSKGPVNTGLDASCTGFQRYKTGVLTDCTKRKNHAVLAVGFGHQDGMDTWTIKNSWGIKWGDKGFIKIQRNAMNVAGIGTDGSAITCSVN